MPALTNNSAQTSKRVAGDPEAAARTPLPRKKRLRAVVVCTRCKRLRVQCDQRRPCGACVKASQGGTCTYAPWPGEASAETSAAASRTDPSPSTSAIVASGPRERCASADEQDALRRRVAELERRLDTMVAHHTPVSVAAPEAPAYPPGAATELSALVGRFPPMDECQTLLRDFLNFDLMFRMVHAASFRRRCESLLLRMGGDDWMDADVPLLAMLAGALLIAAASTPTRTQVDPREERESRLRSLMNALLSYAEDRGVLGVDYVHALLIGIMTHSTGQRSSPAKGWLATCKAYSAALLAGIQRDQAGETVLEREVRRRIWWHIVFIVKMNSERLNIEWHASFPAVPQPMVVTDASLDPLDTGEPDSGVPEWAYVAAKLLWLDYYQKRDVLMADERTPLLERVDGAHALVDKMAAALPPYLSPDSQLPQAPPWVYMQACITAYARDDSVVQLYRAHFGSPDAVLAATALDAAVSAAHRLIGTIQAMAAYMLFTWIDAPTTALWTNGMKAFNGGMVMAYALLRGEEDSALAARHQTDLDTAIGLLRSSASMVGSAHSNAQALETLERLRNTILARSGDGSRNSATSNANADTDADVVDPYTGIGLSLPQAASDAGLPAEWIEWDVLFRELFQESGQGAGGQDHL